MATLKRYPVQVGKLQIPFLGNWTLRPVAFNDPTVNSLRIVAGPLEFPDEDRDRWDGKSLVIDPGPQPTTRTRWPGSRWSIRNDP